MHTHTHTHTHTSPQALREAVVLGKKDSTGSKVMETYRFLVNSVVLRNGKSERYHDALDLWDQAIATFPEYAMPYGWKGVVLYKMGRLEEAMKLLDLAIKSGVSDPDVFYHMGLCRLATGTTGGGRGVEIEAKALFRRALELDASHTGAKEQLSRLK